MVREYFLDIKIFEISTRGIYAWKGFMYRPRCWMEACVWKKNCSQDASVLASLLQIGFPDRVFLLDLMTLEVFDNPMTPLFQHFI